MIKPEPVPAVPSMTAKVAKAAFPKGNLYLRLREEFGVLYQDVDFAELFSSTGQPGIAPWRLALVTVFQFLEDMSDRQAADAVRGRIDWKYALSLELDDPGFNYSVLSEFRTRLVEGGKSELILDRMLEHFKAKGLLKKRGKQRTDSTHVLGHVRFMSRLELLGETMRAALNQIATIDPEWLRGVATEEWHKRYDRVVDGLRLPESKAAREALALTIGEDGFTLLDALKLAPDQSLVELDKVRMLKRQWDDHYELTGKGKGKGKKIRMRDGPKLARATEAVRSPYETEVRYCNRGGGKEWVGYKVHLTESCDENLPRLLVNVHTVPAPEHDKYGLPSIHQRLLERDLLPQCQFADTGYVSVETIGQMAQTYAVQLIGPPRDNPSWQSKVEGGFTAESFHIDWEKQTATCPNGKTSISAISYQRPLRAQRVGHYVQFAFAKKDCEGCGLRDRCTRLERTGRRLNVFPKEQYEALKAIRELIASEQGQREYAIRMGIEGTISQGARAFPLRRCRYRGKAKTQFQQIASGAAINLVRVDDWLQGKPRGETRVSRFARLKPQPSAVA